MLLKMKLCCFESENSFGTVTEETYWSIKQTQLYSIYLIGLYIGMFDTNELHQILQQNYSEDRLTSNPEY